MATIPFGGNSPAINFEVISVLEEVGVNPIRVLAQIANGENGADLDQQLTAAKELVQYLHPKKRSLDTRSKVDAHVTYNVIQFAQVAPEEAQALREKARLMLTQPKSRASIKGLVVEAKENQASAALLEVMRDSVERIIVDENGFVPGRSRL